MSQRIHHLDGLRGWAALSVLLFHVFWETLGAKFPEFRSHSLSFIFNGPLAVCIFFIISGDALLSPCLGSGNISEIQKISLARYTRLTVPILLSCLVSYLLLISRLSFNVEAAKLLNREEWLGAFVDFQASFIGMLKYSTYGVYFTHTTASSYNPFLWTMSLEMLGSLMIFTFAIQVERLKHPIRVAALIAMLLFLAKSYYSLFFVGATLSLARRQGIFHRLATQSSQWYSWLIVLGVVVSCIFQKDIASSSLKTNILRATLLAFAANANPTLIKALSTKLSLFLGKISFPLYLVHFSVIISFTSYLVLEANAKAHLNQGVALLIGLMSVALSVILAKAFLLLEKPLLSRVNSLIAKA